MFTVINTPVVTPREYILKREFETQDEAIAFACELFQYICYGGYRSEYVLVKNPNGRTVSRMVYHHPRINNEEFDRRKQNLMSQPPKRVRDCEYGW